MSLKGKAFTEKMNAAKAAKHRERQRHPERPSNAGPDLTGKKLDHRLGPIDTLDKATALVRKHMGLDPGQSAQVQEPEAPKAAAASVPAKRELKRERKVPLTPPKKGVLAAVVTPKQQPKQATPTSE